MIKKILYRSLNKNPEMCKKFIGTGVIEEDYFSNLT
ncbi:hypothetical protein BAZSYMA_ACONTIG167839_2 [Bathymodiolus azoricus thioautotrophic gill symbiont]|uniref:Uncharacterized protein n=1 Tax=Bathymodiolus azoricus thioautotrophic gill symbiont TaxID=235205 RepID=A0A1H6MSJ0_9GAMM|nr:hypothetical protein BAZSYMA_ACONTIG167839_2 [Bathymodiolus azoricus thioautotrophic gill symbiont]